GRAIQGRPRLGEAAPVAVERGEADRLAGEERAHVEELPREGRRWPVEPPREDVPGQERRGPLAPKIEDPRPRPASALHDAEAGQITKRFANRAPAAGELDGELALGREAQPRGIGARNDAPEDLVRDASHLALRGHVLSISLTTLGAQYDSHLGEPP